MVAGLFQGIAVVLALYEKMSRRSIRQCLDAAEQNLKKDKEDKDGTERSQDDRQEAEDSQKAAADGDSNQIETRNRQYIHLSPKILEDSIEGQLKPLVCEVQELRSILERFKDPVAAIGLPPGIRIASELEAYVNMCIFLRPLSTHVCC